MTIQPTVPALADEYLRVAAELISLGKWMEIHDVFRERHGPITSEALRQICSYIEQRGWATPEIAPMAMAPPQELHPAGYDRLAELDKPTPVPSTGMNITIGSIENSGQFAVGDSNSQVQHNGLTIDQLTPLLNLIGELKATQPDDSEWEELEAEILEANDDLQRADAVEKVKTKFAAIVTGTSGSLVAAGLLEVGKLLLG